MRILLVEDEKGLAEGLKAVLEQELYSVDMVHDGISGLEYILSNIYDIIILDIMLPKLNGIDILKNARNEGIKTPVILLTAKSQIQDKIDGLDNGADDYITKPFDTDELLARIRARTRNTETSSHDDLCFADITLCRRRQELKSQTHSIKLGNKEFQLMEYFIINSRQILTREMLITKIWGPLDDSEYNNIEVYISFLRKKLRFIKANVRIETTKNVGYSLEESTYG